MLALMPSLALAEAPRPERLEGCRDAVMLAAEHYDVAGAAGWGRSLDWIGCLPARATYTAGVADYRLAGSRWTVGRGAYALALENSRWVAAELAAGSGRNAAGPFDYLTLRDSFTLRAGGRFFGRVEHQYVDIAGERGHLAKLSASVLATPSVLLELAGLRSLGGSLGTRGVSARADWVDPRFRVYAGGANTHAAVQAVDIITGRRLADSTTREAFAGIAVPFTWGELQAAYDEQRTAAVRRRTVTVALRWLLP